MAFKADGEIAQVKRKVESDSEDFGKIREAATQDLKEYQSDLATAQNQAYKEESMRHLEDQATLDKEEEKQTSVIAIANERHADKVEYVERMDKRAHETTVAGTEGDLEDRLKADKSMSEVELTIEEKAVAEQKKHVENSKKLEDISVTLSRQQAQAQQEKTDKNREAQQVLDQIDNKPKDKVKVANELGEEYPEGVSQESFTRKDQNGLVTAAITRRVVVIDGHADVYVRTQTSNGTTYNKNGNPIVQHVWNSETQGPHLERHF